MPVNRLLEEYVEEVCAGLRPLPTARREQEIAEIRQHLEAAVEAGRQEGMGEDAAVAEALRRFGDSRTVRSGLLRAWRREQPAWLASPLGAVFVALGTQFALGKLLLATGATRLLFEGLQKLDREWLKYEPSFIADGVQGLLFFAITTLLFGVPAMLVGTVTGYLSPRRAAPAVAAVLLLPMLVIHLSMLATGATLLRFTPSGPMYRLGASAGEAASIVTYGWAHLLWGLAFGVGAAALLSRRAARRGRRAAV